LAFANIEKAANYYYVNLVETSWPDPAYILKRIEESLPPKVF